MCDTQSTQPSYSHYSAILPCRTPYIVNSLEILQRNRFPVGTSEKFWSILFSQDMTFNLLSVDSIMDDTRVNTENAEQQPEDDVLGLH